MKHLILPEDLKILPITHHHKFLAQDCLSEQLHVQTFLHYYLEKK